MNAVDGNAIGGLLAAVFGHDMTTAVATCANCGATAPLAEYVVYLCAPGDVVLCRACGRVVAVLVTVRGITCLHLEGFSRLDA